VTEEDLQIRPGLDDTQEGVRKVLFPPGGQTLVTLTAKGRLSLWDVASGARLEEWAVPVSRVYSYALTFDGRYLAAGKNDGRVVVYRTASKHKSVAPPQASTPAGARSSSER
jgi:WD40 repeat protein